MKIRFFNTYEPASPFYRDLIPFLASRGVNSEIVISRAVYRDRPRLEQTIGDLENVGIFRTINLGIQPTSKIAKILVMFLYIVHSALHSLLGPQVSYNVFLSQPPLFSLWGFMLLRLRSQPYYCVVMDVYPQEAVEFGVLPCDSLLTKTLSCLSSLAVCKAEGVIVIGRCMVDRMAAIGVSRTRIHFIPNWVDEEQIRPVPHENNRLRQNQGWQGKFVVLYGGNIGMAQYFDDILIVAEQMESNSKVLFVFIGDGSRKSEIKQWVANRHLSNVIILPFLHDKYPLAEILSGGDIHFISLRDACVGLGVPSKAYASLAVGRPIVYQGSKEGEIARMIQQEDIGTVVACGDVEELRQVILKYATQPDLRRTQGYRARRLAESLYSRSAALERYATRLIDQCQ